MHLFSNILGVFVFDAEFKVVDELEFKSPEDYKNREKFAEETRIKHKGLKEPGKDALEKILLHFKDKRFFNAFYNANLILTKLDVKSSVNHDTLLIQSINLIGELDKAANLLAKRLREWYGLHNPEFSRAMGNHEEFAGKIIEKEKSALLDELGISANDSIGADLSQEDLKPIMALARQIFGLYQLRKGQESYISGIMGEICPNIKSVCGILVGAQLIEHAGSLKRLSQMPASTIQILGAEKALFRHMKTGAKPPRHGVIVNHPMIANAPNSMHGRIARALADKISIASKVDYFKGKFIGDRLKEGLESKFSKHQFSERAIESKGDF